MEIVEQTKTLLNGGQFLVKESSIDDTFIPEEMDEEQQMIFTMVKDFLHNQVVPNFPQIEKQEEGVTTGLFKQMGELGLLGAHMPETYGGLQLDTNTNTIIADALGPAKSFTVSFAAHTGIGMLPILYYGTEEQKSKYLPKLISGEARAAYCLTEPGSGSDALAAKTRADLTADGKFYEITGQKMWITNAGFADTFIVFAKIDGEHFTGFIVDKDTEGLTLGAEEDKLGIKGSSTRQVFFEKAKVPADNVLGDIGKGHRIAFNALNIGRFKLGALCMGGAKQLIDISVKYSNERKQFDRPISSFGAIKYKLAEQATKVFAFESAQYRVSDLIQKKIKELVLSGKTYAEAKLKAAEEYAIECAIVKVAGSETLDYVVDEALQIHGGYGFSEEYPLAGAYRDSRINRIYEGTNEINRLLIIDMLFKRVMKGSVDMVGPAWEVQKELAKLPSLGQTTGPYGDEIKAIKDLKKLSLMVLGAAAKKQMDGKLNLEEEQQIVMNCADMLIDLFMMESLLLRVQKLDEIDSPLEAAIYKDVTMTFFHDAQHRICKNAYDAIGSFVSGDLLRIFLMGIKRFSQYPIVNVKEKRRNISEQMILANKNVFAEPF